MAFSGPSLGLLGRLGRWRQGGPRWAGGGNGRCKLRAVALVDQSVGAALGDGSNRGGLRSAEAAAHVPRGPGIPGAGAAPDASSVSPEEKDLIQCDSVAFSLCF